MFMRSPMHPDNFIFVKSVVAHAKRKAKKKLPKKTGFERIPYREGMGSEFYSTNEWRTLRWQVLQTSKKACNVCGRSYSKHKVILHVDHIKPRSKFPSLELSIANLQVLCEDCNLGKGASY